MFDNVGGMADHARHQRGAVFQFDVLPHPPFVFVTHIGEFERHAASLHLQDDVDDVLERNVVLVRSVVAAPADMQPDFFARNLISARD